MPDMNVAITRQEVAENMKMAGTKVAADPCTITWEKYRRLYDPTVASALDKILRETMPPFLPNEFQQILLHTMGSGKDVFAIVGTGTGKSEASGFAAHLLRNIFQESKGLIIVLIPLNCIGEEMSSAGKNTL